MKVGITSTVTESPDLHRTDGGESGDPTMAFLAALGALVPGLVANPAAVTGTGTAAKAATGTSGIGSVETGKSGPTLATPATALSIPAKLNATAVEGLAVAGQGGASEAGAKEATAKQPAALANATLPASIAPTSIAPTSIAPTSIAPTSIAPTSIANLLNTVAGSDGTGVKISDAKDLPEVSATQVVTGNVSLPTTPASPVPVAAALADSFPTKTMGKESEATAPTVVKPEPTLAAVVETSLPAATTAAVPTQSSPSNIAPNIAPSIATKVAPSIATNNLSMATTGAPDAVEVAKNEATTPVASSAPDLTAGQVRPVMDPKVAGANSTLSSGSGAVVQATTAPAGRTGDHGHEKPADSFKGQTGAQTTSAPTNLAVPPVPARAEFAPTITTPATLAARPQIADQLAPYVTALRHQPDGTHQITVVLHPAELGQVQVMVELRNGTVQLQLSGAHEAARAVLNDALPQLRRELTDAGLTVGSADVMAQDFGTGTGSTAGGNSGQNYQPGASARAVPRDVGGSLRTPVVDSFASPVRSVIHAGVLDVNI